MSSTAESALEVDPATGGSLTAASLPSSWPGISSRLRAHLVGFLRRDPRLFRIARAAYLGVWRRRAAFAARLSASSVPVPLTLRVDPRRISRAGVGWGAGGPAAAPKGDWDLDAMPFEHLDMYQSLAAHFLHQVPWPETPYYHGLVAGVDPSACPWPIDGPDDLQRWLLHLELLYRLARDRAAGLADAPLGVNDLDEISVRIGRDGALLADRGRHWLAIARLAGLRQVTVRVTARHPEWRRFRAQVLRYAAEHGGSVYQQILHPDLADIPAGHGHQRFEMLRAHLGAKGGKLLDIGANWGYFCHRFEEEGFECYAVERSLLEFSFLERLRRAEGRRFTAINLDVFRFLERSEFDVVLALNIFHHFLKTEDDHARLVQLLRRLRASELILETHDPSEPQMRGAYRNLEPLEFVQFVAEQGGFDRWECLGAADEAGRRLYKLTASHRLPEIRDEPALDRYAVEVGTRPAMAVG